LETNRKSAQRTRPKAPPSPSRPKPRLR
jgi:hypothetical protein